MSRFLCQRLPTRTLSMRNTVRLRVGISALIAFCSSAASAVCQDENPDCINWAAAGECDRNMAYSE